ncbi:MAG: extracellular solute-binding protein [Actinomycetaceae bacterium]|nr:extracellular solute-binding protein [Actinomycetaceae bacterium]MDY6082368.1 extracellular solute-binding protein [Actinomycetaceae bacterium]
MNKVTKIAIICTAGLLASSLSACGGSSSSAGAESKEITIWTQTSGPDAEAQQATFNAYNATNPTYKVKMVSMKKETFNAKLATAARSGKDVPDIAVVASEEVPTWQSQGILAPWGDSLNGTKVTAAAYVPAAWKAGQVDGQQYGVPGTMPTWISYYNKDLVDKYVPGALDDGIITFDEIEAAGAKAKADGVYSYANAWPFQNYDNLYLQMGGTWLDDAHKISVDNKTSTAVFAELQKLADSGYMVPNGEDADKAFLNGKVIFMPEGTWMLNTFKDAKFKWGESLVPQWDVDNLVQCSGTDQYVIVKASAERSAEKMKGMAALMEWLQSNQLEMLKSGANPSATGMLENAEYTSMPQSFLLKDSKMSNAVNIITTPGLSYVNSEIDARAWDMIDKKADIASTMATIQKTVEQKVAQH